MNRSQLEDYIVQNYNVVGEYPWIKYPTFAVFRHGYNRKWFAVTMTIEKRKLHVDEDGMIDVLNLKCDPNQIISLRQTNGIYPAYHMSKEHWITIALDGRISKEMIIALLSYSYDVTM